MKKIIHVAVFALGMGFVSAQMPTTDQASPKVNVNVNSSNPNAQVKVTSNVPGTVVNSNIPNTMVNNTPSVSDLTSKEGIKNAVKAEATKKVNELKDKAATKINDKVKSSTGISNVLPTSASVNTNNPAVTTTPPTTAVVPAAVTTPSIDGIKNAVKTEANTKATELKDKASSKVKEKTQAAADKLMGK